MSEYGKYGDVSIMAAEEARENGDPINAWCLAAEQVFYTKSSRDKGCPKCAFLGLASAGLIRGVPSGEYTKSKDNKRYALQAVSLLKENPKLANDIKCLWECVMQGEKKTHDGQMNVVCALWSEGYIDKISV
ncbi:MAG: DUF6979 family protein [Pseudohongiellaceae bacterium]